MLVKIGKANFPIHSLYLSELMVPHTLRKIVNKTISLIKKHKIKFDAIAFRGLSGSLAASAISIQLNKPLIAIRKNSSHGDKVEGYVLADTYIIIDDFIDSGKTIKSILRDIDGMCVGIVLYGQSDTKSLHTYLPKHEQHIPFYVVKN